MSDQMSRRDYHSVLVPHDSSSNTAAWQDEGYFNYPRRWSRSEDYEWSFRLEGPGTPDTTEECCSSVVFIPGHQATRLLSADNLGDRLWEPSTNNEVEALYLNTNGESINPNIVTDGIIDEAFGAPALANIYKSFIAFMDGLVEGKTINAWEKFEYDWRKDLSDIVENGVATSTGHYDMATRLEELAADSQTGKVTIITHSNGGLVAKFLIDRLAREGKVELVDKLIMVAAPQIGTPQAVATLLHGEDIGFPKNQFMDRIRQRTLGENMVSAYNLMPSEEYFRRVIDPVIEFDPTIDSVKKWRSLYGNFITNRAELDDFITGGDGRAEPIDTDTITPNVLKSSLLEQSKTNQEVLDSWVSPENVEVTQIVGWGLDTIRGMRYVTRDKKICGGYPYYKCVNQKTLDHEPIWQEVVDGDKTVLGMSAMYLVNGNEYFLNLPAHNRELGRLRINREHADILEPQEALDLIENLITLDTFDLPRNVSLEIPTVVGTHLRLRVLSPVSIEVVSSRNEITNSTIDEIPNSYYTEFGEGKYIGLDTEDTYTINLRGTDMGTFTFIIEQVSNDPPNPPSRTALLIDNDTSKAFETQSLFSVGR